MSWLPIVGDVIEGVGNFFSQQDTNKANVTLAKEQMDFQAQQASTTHQREVKDLQAAGLNPILSAGGNGAPAMAGAAPSLVAPKIEGPDLFSMYTMNENLKLQKARLLLDAANSESQRGKRESDITVNEVKKMLMQRGMPAAELGGEAADVIRKGMKYLKDAIHKNYGPLPGKKIYISPEKQQNQQLLKP